MEKYEKPEVVSEDEYSNERNSRRGCAKHNCNKS